MNHTGVRSTGSRRSARSRRSFTATPQSIRTAPNAAFLGRGYSRDGGFGGTVSGFDESEFGPNAWLVDELYQQYAADPESVSEAWREYFEDYQPRTGNGEAAPESPAPPPEPAAVPATPVAPPVAEPQKQTATQPTVAEASTADGTTTPL